MITTYFTVHPKSEIGQTVLAGKLAWTTHPLEPFFEHANDVTAQALKTGTLPVAADPTCGIQKTGPNKGRKLWKVRGLR